MPSGHSASSFAAAVHFSMVHQELHGGSAWAWGGSLAVASATAFLRVAAGKHHPTDVVAGAALGAFVGWLVPTLHEADENGAPPTEAPLITFGGRF
jgi:membrane-associated phospholipid phosphatase